LNIISDYFITSPLPPGGQLLEDDEPEKEEEEEMFKFDDSSSDDGSDAEMNEMIKIQMNRLKRQGKGVEPESEDEEEEEGEEKKKTVDKTGTWGGTKRSVMDRTDAKVFNTWNFLLTLFHRRMARGDHRLPQVLPWPAMPDPSTPCGQASPETALWPF
jgi:hypothetical protein